MSYHSLRLRAPAWYLGALTVSSGSKVLLGEIVEACLHGRPVALTQKTWGNLHHRDARSIRRQLAELRRRGLIRVIRRGRRLSNVYRLARALWGRLTGRLERRMPNPVMQQLLPVFQRIEAHIRGGRAAPPSSSYTRAG